MNRVVVTGASGFVGSHLLEALSSRHVRTTALYHSRAPDGSSPSEQGAIEWVACDLTKDDSARHLSGAEVVFHLAGYAGLGSDAQTVERLNRVNVLATRLVASAALKARCQLVYVSSVHACDDVAGSSVVDGSNGRPRSEYGRSKRSAEEEISKLVAEGLDFVTLRPTQLFGEYHEGSVCELARAIKRRRFVLIGDGENATNFLYVKDFVDMLLRVAQNPVCNRQTYIAADDPMPLISMAQHISAHVGVALPAFRVPRPLGLAIGSACDVVSSAFKLHLPLSRHRVVAMTGNVRYSRQRLSQAIGPELPYGAMAGLTRTLNWFQSAGVL